MSPGIDTGNIILLCWLPRLIVDGVNETDIDTNYRAIYSFIDPWIRAVVLREFIQNANDKFMDADSIVQSEADGSTYHFMHKRMKKSSLEYFFNQGMSK